MDMEGDSLIPYIHFFSISQISLRLVEETPLVDKVSNNKLQAWVVILVGEEFFYLKIARF